jgi:hypothetical protein
LKEEDSCNNCWFIPLVPEDTESLSRLENGFAALQILSISYDIDAVCALHPHSPNDSSTQHIQGQEVYADSLSWGIVPTTRQRLPFEQRWPGVLENALISRDQKVRVLEDCLNGRRTVWEDPFKPGRNGQIGLAQRIEMHSPLALVILMLGTNDFQSMHHDRYSCHGD